MNPIDKQKAVLMEKLGPLRDAINDIENANDPVSFVMAAKNLTVALFKIKGE